MLSIPSNGSGEMVDVIPNTMNMLKILLPITLPTASPGFPLMAATTEVASSGSDVPIATMVSPTTPSLMPAFIAIDEAPATNLSPPKISAVRPSTIYSMERHTGISRLFCPSVGVCCCVRAAAKVWRMKSANANSRNMPSVREIMLLPKPLIHDELPKAHITTDERSNMGSSVVMMVRSTFIGRTSAVMPMIASILKMLLPMVLPTAKGALPFSAECNHCEAYHEIAHPETRCNRRRTVGQRVRSP